MRQDVGKATMGVASTVTPELSRALDEMPRCLRHARVLWTRHIVDGFYADLENQALSLLYVLQHLQMDGSKAAEQWGGVPEGTRRLWTLITSGEPEKIAPWKASITKSVNTIETTFGVYIHD
jgi:hypothetical protein